MDNKLIFLSKFIILSLFPIFFFSQNSSVDSLIKLYENDNKNQDLIIKIGEAFAAEKKWDQAIKYYSILVQIEPENSDYLYRLGGTQAAYSEIANKFKVLSIINSAKRNLIRSASNDSKHIYSRWALVQILTELPNILGGDKTEALNYSNEIYFISKIHGLLSLYYIYNYQNKENLKHSTEENIIDEILENPILFDFNYFNFIVGKILFEKDIDQEKLSVKYLERYISSYSSSDRFSLDEVYYYLAYCNYNIGNKNSGILLSKSREIAMEAPKKNYNLITKIEELNKLINQ